ncbi:hemerythrin domain-containing protein [Acidihalobacter prosperus]|uniref:Hemerythrin n=1 Tax=Acidihalobacter prosperus TaxID=160660 RepID=A0A1A6C3V7_9GAMM|nr:hemerythrin domain-containing protein [Acidihalobacter prosperus]OBS09243.1 hemerythrin [Acidihalobacter prosperus]
MNSQQIDLAARGEQTEHSYLLGRLRGLVRGQQTEILAYDDPRILLDALTLELRNGIYWDVVEAGPPVWRVRVRRREDVAASDLVDLLTRDHVRVDHLFATALHRSNAGDMDTALAHFRVYAACLRRHVEAENDLVVPVLSLPRSARGDDPTSIMLREHEEIIEHTVMIEEMLDEGMDDAGMLAPFFAIISGQLAKHEWREENNLFPHWMRALRHEPAIADELFPRVQGLVRAGDEAAATLGIE